MASAYAAATGSSQHIAAELLVKRAGLKATLVPYRGSAQAQPDLMAGRIAFMFDNLPSALPQARAGKVKALAQTCATRSPSAPDLPTMVEAGFADFVVDGWYGMFAPARTPKPIVDKLSADINKALKDPDVAREVEDAGLRSDRHDAGRVRQAPEGRPRLLEADDRVHRRQGGVGRWMYDLKIVGGDIVDGTARGGGAATSASRTARSSRWARRPGKPPGPSMPRGRVVAPGFVDIHTHYDAQVLWDPCSPSRRGTA